MYRCIIMHGNLSCDAFFTFDITACNLKLLKYLPACCRYVRQDKLHLPSRNRGRQYYIPRVAENRIAKLVERRGNSQNAVTFDEYTNMVLKEKAIEIQRCGEGTRIKPPTAQTLRNIRARTDIVKVNYPDEQTTRRLEVRPFSTIVTHFPRPIQTCATSSRPGLQMRHFRCWRKGLGCPQSSS